MLKKLRQVLLTVLPTVIYAHIDYDNEQNADPPLIVYQEIGKRPPQFGDDKPVYYVRTICQITKLHSVYEMFITPLPIKITMVTGALILQSLYKEHKNSQVK